MADISDHMSPFKLSLIIHGASNLPVADITSSDPYVVAIVGEKRLGQTATMKRNLNPRWEKAFSEVPLLHLKQALKLRLYDEDPDKNDDFMGLVEVDLSTTPQNKMIPFEMDLDTNGTPFTSARASILFSVMLERNDTIIRFDKKKRKPQYSVAVGDTLRLIDNELEKMNATQPVKQALLQSSFVNSMPDFIKPGVIQDLLMDVYDMIMMTSGTAIPPENAPERHYRTCRKLISSTNIDVRNLSHRSTPSYPRLDIGISFIFKTHQLNPVFFKMPNKYMAWNWIKWLRMAFNYWDGRLDAADIPDWAKAVNNKLSSSIPLRLTIEGEHYEGRFELSLAQSCEYKLRCRDMETSELLLDWSLKDVTSVNISADSLPPQKYTLRLTIDAFSLKGDKAELIAGESSLQTEHCGYTPGHLLRKGALAIVSTVRAVKDTVADTATNAGGAVVSGARVLGTGDVQHVLSAVHTTAVGVGSRFKKTGRNLVEGKIGQINTELVLKVGGERIVHSIGDINAPVELSVDLSDQKLDNINKKSFDILVYRGQPGMEAFVTGQVVPLSDILGCHQQRDGRPVLQRDPEKLKSEFSLNKNMSIRLSILGASGLRPLDGIQPDRTLQITAKFVRWNGEAKSKSYPTFKTSAVKSNKSNPVWEGQDFVFTMNDGYEWADSLRLELFLSGPMGTNEKKLGAAFIPVEDLTVELSRPALYPLVKFRQEDSGNEMTAEGGNVIVKFVKIVEPNTETAVISLEHSIFASDEHCTSFPGEAVLAGSIDVATTGDELDVVASFNGLEITLPEVSWEQEEVVAPSDAASSPRVTISHTPARSLASTRVDRTSFRSSTTSRASAASGPAASIPDVITVEIFENEAKHIIKGFGPGYLNFHPHFSDETGTKDKKCDSISTAEPPEGYQWVEKSNWQIDRKYTQQDNDGWSYALSIELLSGNVKKKASIAKPNPLQGRRRRKWIRQAKLREEVDPSRGSQVVTRESENFSSRTIADIGKPLESLLKTGPVPKTRATLLSRHPDQVLMLCEERSDLSMNTIIIPWSRVSAVDVVTPSVLMVRTTVNRLVRMDTDQEEGAELDSGSTASMGTGCYLTGGSSGSGGGGAAVASEAVDLFVGEPVYREAEIEIFVYNCPAKALAAVMNGRIGFSEIREMIGDALEKGHAAAMAKKSGKIGAADRAPDTVQLSVGAEAVLRVDDIVVDIDREAKRLQQKFEETRDEAYLHERAVLEARVCRLMMYVGALLGESVDIGHGFSDEDFNALFNRDMSAVFQINQENEIDTANNRIEFLLDAAEARLRDAALTGWNQQKEMKKFMEKIVNNYLIEMAALLGKFFESTKVLQSAKGLSTKTKMLSTFMRHNDRLHQILESVLRPYDFGPQRQPLLSIFLDINSLTIWYATVVNQEMVIKVDERIAFFKDSSKFDMDLRQKFQTPLPWLPFRKVSSGRESEFMTQNPENIRDLLTIYMANSRQPIEDVAASFLPLVHVLDEKINISLVNCFNHFSQATLLVLLETEWSCLGEKPSSPLHSLGAAAGGGPGVGGGRGNSFRAALAEGTEQLIEERIWFLCSVANDAQRMRQPGFIPVDVSTDESGEWPAAVKNSIQSTMGSCLRCIATAADRIACLVFARLSTDSPLWLQPDSHSTWLSSSRVMEPAPTAEPSEGTFSRQLLDLQDYLETFMDYLHPFCFFKLLRVCFDKALVSYLWMLRHAQEAGRIFARDGPELAQMQLDIEAVKGFIQTTMYSEELYAYNELEVMPVSSSCLDVAHFLIQADRSDGRSDAEDEAFTAVLHRFQIQSHGSAGDALCAHKFLQTCISLRSDCPRIPAPPSPGKRGGGAVQERDMPDLRAFLDEDVELNSIMEEIEMSFMKEFIPENIEDRTVFAKVFNVEEKYSHLTAESLLLHSGRACGKDVADSKKSRGMFTGIFSSSGAATSSSPVSNTTSPLYRHPTAQLNAVISNIQARYLPHVHSKITACLEFRVGGSVVKTSFMNAVGSDVGWHAEIVEIVLDGAHAKMSCTLLYKGVVFGTDTVGVAEVPISSLRVSSIEKENYPIDFSVCKKAQELTLKSQHAEPPAIQLSMKLKSV